MWPHQHPQPSPGIATSSLAVQSLAISAQNPVPMTFGTSSGARPSTTTPTTVRSAEKPKASSTSKIPTSPHPSIYNRIYYRNRSLVPPGTALPGLAVTPPPRLPFQSLSTSGKSVQMATNAFLNSLNKFSVQSPRDYLNAPQHPYATPSRTLILAQRPILGSAKVNPKHIPYISPDLDNPGPIRYPHFPHGFGRDPKEFDRRNFKSKLPDRPLNEFDLRAGLQFYNVNLIRRAWSYTKFSCAYHHNRLTSPALEALEKCQALRVIDLEGNRIESVDEIPHWPKITAINLRKNRIKCLKGFKPSYTLEYLNVSCNRLKTMDEINGNGFHVLRQLEIRCNQIESLGQFNLKNLEQIFMADNQITSLAPLKNCRKLRAIHARSNRITTLKYFPLYLPDLEYVNLRDNGIERISHLERLGKNPVKALILTGNYVARSEKYRVEVYGLVPTLRRLDKEAITGDEIAKATYLGAERALFQIPPVRDETRLRAPPPSPV